MLDLKKLAVESFVTPPTKNNVGSFVVDPLVGSIFLTYKKFIETDENIFVYCANNFEINEFYNSLICLIDKKNIILLQNDELVRVEYLSESKEMLAEQIYSLYELINAKHKIIIVSPSILYKFLPSPETFLSSCRILKKGHTYNFEEIKNYFAKSGYSRVNRVDQSLQYAVRGDIIDVYSLNYENPIRIEFFDDEIESIRFFNVSSQTSYEEKDEVKILPGTLVLLTDEEKQNLSAKLNEKLETIIGKIDPLQYHSIKSCVLDAIHDFADNILSQNLYKYFSIIQDNHFGILDYVDNYICIVNDYDAFSRNSENIFYESEQFINELFNNGKSLPRLEYFNKKLDAFSKASFVYKLSNFYAYQESQQIGLTRNSLFASRELDLFHLLNSYNQNGYKILCFLDNKEQISKLEETLDISGLSYIKTHGFELNNGYFCSISDDYFTCGFEFKEEKICILTAKQLFGYHKARLSYSTKFKEGIVLDSYQDLEPGDYVVHEKSGIGRFVEISTLEINGKHEDYLKIQYDGSEVLYVPLYQFSLVRKYVGKDGYAPKLNKLYSTKWENTKKKIKERINDLADRLIDLYTERANVQGISFEPCEEIEQEFADKFEYELTRDQVKSLEEIFKDMESSSPMDRLLCGDVGFGKTEIAFRAAFRSILNNKLVILLCPTTLLARQHYEVATKRFNNFDVRISLYTRNTSSKEAKAIERNIKDGKVHFIIGTHKILSNRIDTSNLGLLIIDEEQRFGVEQKERIKERSKNIDVLTLSATPIPRTLQSSLIGMKQVSTIQTAPKERFAIQTYVIPYDQSVVRELIMREMSRHGQIFYVHNEVYSIYDKCRQLQELVPDCKIGVIHGQMDKEDASEIMQEFYDGNIDLLLATTIIENGIDVENANLMLVENADKFGLAQLYQIKGRVGRGDRMAYAYLMVKDQKSLNESSQKRLEAIQDLTGLGSGYKIAQRDLLIRGAGDILGPEQAGFIDAVGIDMYIKLLNETVEEKKYGIQKAQEIKIYKDLGIDAYIPTFYIKDEEKVEVYKKILEAKTLEEVNKVKTDLRDIYGPIPENLELLFMKRKINIYLTYDEYEDLQEKQDSVTLILSEKFCSLQGIGSDLFAILMPFLKQLKTSFINKKVNIQIKKKDNWCEILIKIFEIVHDLYSRYILQGAKHEN